MFRLNNPKIQISSGQKVLKAKDYALFLQANQIIDEAIKKAQEIEIEAKKEYENQKIAGYEDGLLEGRIEYAEKMLDTAMQAVEYLESLEQSIVKAVTQSVRKVIGEIDNKELIVKIVKNALLHVHSQQRVLIKISPQDEEAVRSSLAIMLKSAPGSLSFLDILADPRMQQGDCIIESELGLLDASLETQLKAIENSLNRKITAG